MTEQSVIQVLLLVVLVRHMAVCWCLVDTVMVDELAEASAKLARQVRQELERTGKRYLDHLSRPAVNAGLQINRLI